MEQELNLKLVSVILYQPINIKEIVKNIINFTINNFIK